MSRRVHLPSKAALASGVGASVLLLGAVLAGATPAAAAPSDLTVATATASEGRVTVLGTASRKRTTGPVRVSFKTPTSAYVTVGTTTVGRDGLWQLSFTVPGDPDLRTADIHVMVSVKMRSGERRSAQADVAPLVNLSAPSTPAAPPVPAPAPAGLNGDPSAYSFLSSGSNGQPAHWDRCTPISFFVNPSGAPEGAVDVVMEVFAKLGEISGQSFVYGGPTQSKPYLSSLIDLPDAQGNGIYVAFASDSEAPSLAGTVIGRGGHRYSDAGNGTDARIFAGAVLVEDSVKPGFELGTSLGGVLMHELGHVMNLAHVDAPDQLMYPSRSLGSPVLPQAGDLAGLNGLASRGCF